MEGWGLTPVMGGVVLEMVFMVPTFEPKPGGCSIRAGIPTVVGGVVVGIPIADGEAMAA